MDRRSFLKWLALSGASVTLGRGLLGCAGDGGTTPSGSGLADTGPSLMGGLPRTLRQVGRAEQDMPLKVVSGKVPRDIFGSAYVMASIPFATDTVVDSPLIVGSGMVYRLDFNAADLAFKSRFVKTPSYWTDLATEGTDLAYRTSGFARISPSLGVLNYCNTAVVPLSGSRLLATSDAGRPFELDPVTLETLTPVGTNAEWQPALPANLLPGVFPLEQCTAHPAVDDHTGETFFVNFGGTLLGNPGEGFLHLLRWDGSGALERHTLVDEGGAAISIAQSVHQIGVTQDYVVIMDTAFVIEPTSLFGDTSIHAQSPDTIIWIVRRADLSRGGGEVLGRRVVIPGEAAHFLVDYDNPAGRISLHLAHNNASDPSEWVHPGDELFHGGVASEHAVGMLSAPTDLQHLGHHVVDGERATLLDSRVVNHETFTWGTALYAHRGTSLPGRYEQFYWASIGYSPELLTRRVVDAYETYPHRTLPVTDLPREAVPAAVFRLDPQEMDIADGYVFPRGRLGLSPQFLPRDGSVGPTDGYILMTVLSDDTSHKHSTGDEFWIFDAANLEQGPICRLAHPELNMGFTLHTTWFADPQPNTSTYRVDLRADYSSFLEGSSDTVKTLFEDHVFPHYTG